ncbi:hypothetical protein KUTeg_014328 [Tegillarca granosa]|uniref:U3 small nucleolar RNA-associated protein 25 homolog n=1 Tax=Tegillarca granosa TaxID=220873 RepID=A0ABQ9EW92_TEGGR|nr:hypothetical protein KUTeg_014328 [Tegillarca granosa]
MKLLGHSKNNFQENPVLNRKPGKKTKGDNTFKKAHLVMLPKHRRRKMHHRSRKTKKKRKTNPAADDSLRGEKMTATESTQLQESESSESSSESEEENPYQQLMASISGQSLNKTQLLDPFKVHFENDIGEESVDKLSQKGNWTSLSVKVPHVGKAVLTCLESNLVNKKFTEEKDLKKLHKMLGINFESLYKCTCSIGDLYYTERSHLNGEEIRLTYCLHALNHVLKANILYISCLLYSDYRDQGLTRPKVLIVLPFRESALRVVNMMMHLLKSDCENLVSNKKRFLSEYKEENEKEKSSNKPDDYQAIFTGNTDDHFRIGLGVAKKTLKLYTKFYSSDIILASPLGLRTVIGAEGEKDSDYDFLNSIELLIFDQADIYLMQNWDHILHIMNHLHLQPKEAHGIDFSRVRMWTLNGCYHRLRNYFVREEIDFECINEYSTTKNISRARNFFYHGKTHFMLYTERFHFYRRYRIRGIRHIIFYQLPVYPQFYSEMCNMIQDSKIKGDNKTVTCVYSKYDAHRLSDIVGTDRASHMMKASKKIESLI